MVQIINHYAPPTTNLPPMKAIMVLVGLDCGPLRLPLPTLSSQQVESLQADLQAIGFFNFS
jgi:N-acetylneuraminate lyase